MRREKRKGKKEMKSLQKRKSQICEEIERKRDERKERENKIKRVDTGHAVLRT